MAITKTYPTKAQKISREIKKLLCIREKRTDCLGNGAKNIAILTSNHTLFVAYWLGHHLSQHYTVSISPYYDASADNGQPYIVICPQIFSELPKRFITFQMEQSIYPKWFTGQYFTTLRQSLAIFDYSTMNVEFLHGKKLEKDIFHTPLSSVPDYTGFLRRLGHTIKEPRQKIDVLFYGDPSSPHRIAFLDKLAETQNLYIAYKLFGCEMLNLIRSARVIVNIHHQQRSLLETTRLYEALSLGIPIVSEDSVDMHDHEELKDVVHFVSVGDTCAMDKAVTRLLNDKEYYQQQCERIAHFNNRQAFPSAINDYLCTL